ncbi:MAG: transposase [Lysobacteraceae bacterium]|nr:transposase [Silanimonas sp.]
MGGKKYTTAFKVEAAKQVLDHGRPVREVAS